MRRRTWKRILRTLRTVLVVLFVVFVLFLALFYVRDDKAEVVGNTRYTADQIRQMVMTDFKSHNSVYLSSVMKNVVPENVPFVRNIEIRYKNPGAVELRVTENVPVGYIEQDGFDFYFDDTGKVLQADAAASAPEVPSAEPAAKTQEDAASAGEESSAAEAFIEEYIAENDAPADSSVSEENAAPEEYASEDDSPREAPGQEEDAVREEAGNVQETPEEEGSTASEEAAEQVIVNTGSGTGTPVPSGTVAFRAELTDIIRVEGLVEEGTHLRVGMTIIPEDKKIFSSIQALTKILNKLEMTPDYLEITDGSDLNLHFGTIVVALGPDTDLESKMSRASAIMEQLAGMTGTLHLETYSESTVNIVFETDEVPEEVPRDSEDDTFWTDNSQYTEDGELDISWAEAWNQNNYKDEQKKQESKEDGEDSETEIETDAHGNYGTNGYQSQDYG